ncbi:hypothetical protein [Lactobacillus gallinarum]|uniref:hypothetical protein n=1 Tax=Lactobacillus gallinarum TaxID=52242 RepID=UPI00248DDF6B|nr:hypothetical protein [Lactobacillus gallinarum]
MKNSDIKLSDDVDLKKGIELQKILNSYAEKKDKVKELVSNNPELSSYLTELSTTINGVIKSIDNAYGILDILQTDLGVLDDTLIDYDLDGLDNEINSINGVKGILDNSSVELLDTLDSIDKAKGKKED